MKFKFIKYRRSFSLLSPFTFVIGNAFNLIAFTTQSVFGIGMKLLSFANFVSFKLVKGTVKGVFKIVKKILF